MRKLSSLALLLLLVACGNENKNGYTLNGEIRGDIADSLQVFLITTDSAFQRVNVDTTLVQSGKFIFQGEIDIPKLHYLFIDGVKGSVPVILENDEIDVKAQKDSLGFVALKGGLQNNLFMDYLMEQRNMSMMAQSMTKDLRDAQQSGDNSIVEALREEYFELQEKSKKYDHEFVSNNPNSLVSALIIEQIAKRKSLPLDSIKALTSGLSSEMKRTDSAKRINSLIETAEKEEEAKKRTEIGAKAPDFQGPTPDGNVLALNDIKGKLTLVDFWAAWCKPCRRENPNVVAVYNKFKDKGLSVVGVSLDRRKEDWVKAIKDDGLEWNHVSNIKYFNDPIAEKYNINSIPAAFLLDENGVIVAKNLRGKALEDKVAELLN